MSEKKLYKVIFDEISKLKIIDAHEHLSPEKTRIETEVDVFTFFTHYTKHDLLCSGMTIGQYKSLFNRSIPIEIRWKTFTQFWDRIRYTSYSKAVLLSVKKFYGFNDINEKTYKQISSAIKKFNKKGIYKKVLSDACNIKLCLTQCAHTNVDFSLFKPVMPLVWKLNKWEDIINPVFCKNTKFETIDDFIDELGKYYSRVKSEGAVGLKVIGFPYKGVNRQDAISIFNKLKADNKLETEFFNPLREYVVDFAIKLASELDLVIAIHTGYWDDFRDLNPVNIIPILMKYPKNRFDVYHIGYPFVREALQLGKNFPNVWTNFCWAHLVSQKFATETLDETIDLIPTNKIIGFGGDYCTPVEKVYGHLVMARENISKVLAGRVLNRQFTEKQAIGLAKKWFYDNPVELYKL